MKDKLQNLEFRSIYGANTQQGYVELWLDGNRVSTWDIPKAKVIHAMLGECIEAAISDAMLVSFFKQKMDMDDTQCALILRDFRLIRQGSLETVNPD